MQQELPEQQVPQERQERQELPALLAQRIVILDGAPQQVETDKLRLEQILKNLLANAFKFTAKGAVTLTIGPSAAHPNFIEWMVRDTGIGIPEDKHQLIFEAFQQADGSTRRKYGGTGLGLSISRELVRLLGGEITLASRPGEGSEFKVTIPQFKMAAGELAAARERVPQALAKLAQLL